MLQNTEHDIETMSTVSNCQLQSNDNDCDNFTTIRTKICVNKSKIYTNAKASMQLNVDYTQYEKVI